MSVPSPDPEQASDAARSDALARLSETYRPSLVRYFQRRVRSGAEIHDLVQEVFLRLLVRGGVQNLGQVGGYVFETASSILKDRQRRRSARRADAHLPFDPQVHQGESFSAERVLSGTQALRSAALVLLELPERTRTIFILRRLEGLPYQAIAHRLGISVSAVEKHMLRAARRLIERCGEGP